MKILAIEVSQFGNYYNSRYEQIEKYGVELFVMSGHADRDHWREGHFSIAASKDVDDLITLAKELHKEHQFDGVFTFAESSVIATAMIAEALNLQGIGLDAAVKSRNKFFMRNAHKEKHAPHPNFQMVNTLEAALDAAKTTGYPAILKPTLGAGSQFVYKVNNEQELQDVFASAHQGIQTMSHVSNEGLTSQLGPNSLLLESFLDGKEFLIEAYIWDGVTVLGSIVDRVTLEGNSFDDDVHHAPTALSPEQIKLVHAAVHAGAISQGLHRSVMHAEIRFHQGLPNILEIAARPGGGGLDFMARISSNYCPLKATVDICMGRKPSFGDYQPSGTDTFALCLISQQGEIVDIQVPADIKQDPSVFMLKFVAQAGTKIRRPPNGNDIIGFLGVSGTSLEEVEKKAMAYSSAIKVQVK